VTRIGRIIFHNWPLKLAAVVLATMLYAGLVVSSSVQEFPGGVQITPENIPSNASLGMKPAAGIEDPLHRGRGTPSARAAPDSFVATIDLANVDPQATRPDLCPDPGQIGRSAVHRGRLRTQGHQRPARPGHGQGERAGQCRPGDDPIGTGCQGPPIVTPATVSVRGPRFRRQPCRRGPGGRRHPAKTAWTSTATSTSSRSTRSAIA